MTDASRVGRSALSDQQVAEASAETMWAKDSASRSLGMELISVSPGQAVVEMEVRDDMINGWALCHGGLIASLADSTFALACNSRGTVTVAAGFDVTFLKPAHGGDRLRATAVERALRGRSGVYDVTVARIAGAGGRVAGTEGRIAGTGKSTDGAVVAEFRGRSRSLGRPIGPGT